MSDLFEVASPPVGLVGGRLIFEPLDKAFDPNQPRDDSGRWVDGFGVEGPTKKSEAKKLAEASLGRPMTEREGDLVGFIYSSSEGTQINRDLRAGRPESRNARQIAKLLDQSSLPHAVVSYRGVDPKLHQLLERRVGKVFTDRGFTSTGSEKVANEFAKWRSGETVRVLLPKGAKALPTQHVSVIPSADQEIIVQRGSRYKVGKDKRGVYLIYLGSKTVKKSMETPDYVLEVAKIQHISVRDKKWFGWALGDLDENDGAAAEDDAEDDDDLDKAFGAFDPNQPRDEGGIEEVPTRKRSVPRRPSRRSM